MSAYFQDHEDGNNRENGTRRRDFPFPWL